MQPIPDFIQRALDAMLGAGWIHQTRFTDGKGLHIVWKAAGTPAAIWLKLWGHAIGEENMDVAAHALAPLARGQTLVITDPTIESERCLARLRQLGLLDAQHLPNTKLGAAFLTVFSDLIQKLRLADDPDAIIGLFGIVTAWAPDGTTILRPLPK